MDFHLPNSLGKTTPLKRLVTFLADRCQNGAPMMYGGSCRWPIKEAEEGEGEWYLRVRVHRGNSASRRVPMDPYAWTPAPRAPHASVTRLFAGHTHTDSWLAHAHTRVSLTRQKHRKRVRVRCQ